MLNCGFTDSCRNFRASFCRLTETTAGVDQNLKRKSDYRHSGIEILTNGELHRVDLAALTGGKQVTVYGQTEVTKDLMTAREATQLTSYYEAHNVQVKDFYTAPKVEFEYQGKAFQIQV